MKQQLQHAIREVVELLASGKYKEVEILTKGIRLSAEEMAKAISDYGGHLVMPPEKSFEVMDVIEIRNAQPPRWSVAIPLWTQEEGRSDLSLQLTVIGRQERILIELDDIHVL